MTDTRKHLATITQEQLDAIAEIILAAPRGADNEVIVAALERSVIDAVDRAYEVEKLTKLAIERVYVETGAKPSENIVTLVIESVWDTVTAARAHQHDDGLLPGHQQDVTDTEPPTAGDTYVTVYNNTTQPVDLDIETDDPATGTAQYATVNTDGGSTEPTGYDIGGILTPGDSTTITDISDETDLQRIAAEAAKPARGAYASDDQPAPPTSISGNVGALLGELDNVTIATKSDAPNVLATSPVFGANKHSLTGGKPWPPQPAE